MTLVPVPVQSTHILPWQETVQQAQMLVRSGMLPTSVKTPEAALAIILKARELGVGPMEGFEGISVIQGKPTVSPRLQLALIHRSGLLEKLDIQETAEGCTVSMARRGGASFSTRFTLEDARRAGLLGNDNWKKYPANMCRWRAVGYCADVLFSDVTGGAYRPEEMGATVDANGDVLVESSPPVRTGDRGRVTTAPPSAPEVEVVEAAPVPFPFLEPGPPRAAEVEPTIPDPIEQSVTPDERRRQHLMQIYQSAVPAVWATKAMFVEFLKNSWGKERLLDLTEEEVEDLGGAVQAYAAAGSTGLPHAPEEPAPQEAAPEAAPAKKSRRFKI